MNLVVLLVVPEVLIPGKAIEAVFLTPVELVEAVAVVEPLDKERGEVVRLEELRPLGVYELDDVLDLNVHGLEPSYEKI